MAGLCAARHLADAGLRVELFEAQDELGGAARPGWLTGGADEALLEFLSVAGLRRDALEPARVFDVGAGGVLQPAASDDALPPGLYRTRLRLPRFRRVLAGMRGALCRDTPERAARYDDRSIEALAALYLGPAAATQWLEPWLATRAPADAQRTSRVAALLPLAGRRGGPLYALHAPPSRDRPGWTRGVELRCGARVDAIAREAGLVVRAGGETRRPRAVVLAVPVAVIAEVAASLLGRPLARALDALAGRPSATLWCPLRRGAERSRVDGEGIAALRVARERSAAIAGMTIDVEQGLARASLRDGYAQGIPGRAASPAELVAHLEELLPGIYGDARRATLTHDTRAHFDVGRYRALARARRLVAELPDVFVAGEAWSEATLEGAAQSGRRAARDLLAHLSLSG